MGISRIIGRTLPPRNWHAWSKIPWDEPGFSARMLEDHLSQEHDWASRTSAVIDAQVASMHRSLPQNAHILDLGCGPGLYTSRLAALGHVCTGVDFSPASINYARSLPDADGITYVQADVTRFQCTGNYDAILLLFGEINAFSRRDAAAILKSATRALRPGGVLFIEVHSFDSIREIGQLSSSWQTNQGGLFSEKPHLYLEEHFWNDALSIAMTRYYIVDAASSEVAEYTALMQAYTDAQYSELFAAVGLGRAETVSASDWPVGGAFAGKLHCLKGYRPKTA